MDTLKENCRWIIYVRGRRRRIYGFGENRFGGQTTHLPGPWTSFSRVQARIPRVFMDKLPFFPVWRGKFWKTGQNFGRELPQIVHHPRLPIPEFPSPFVQSISSLPVCHSDAIHIPESFSRRSFLDQNLSWTSFAVCQIQNFSWKCSSPLPFQYELHSMILQFSPEILESWRIRRILEIFFSRLSTFFSSIYSLFRLHSRFGVE